MPAPRPRSASAPSVSVPPDLEPPALVAAVRAAGGSWTAITSRAEVDSTNTLALAAGRAGAASGTCFVADHQVQGRGRQARRWVAAPGTSAMFSVVLRPGPAAAPPGLLPLAVGVAVARAVAGVSGLSIHLKWPNDVLAPTPSGELGKCAGLLAESDPSVGVVVVGVGINVGMSQPELPVPAATSLLLAGAGPVSRTEVVGRSLAGIQQMFGLWLGGWADPILAGYRQLCATLGQYVTVDTPSGQLAGHAVDIGPGGELIIDVAGTRRELVAGDVWHVRPAGPAGS